MMESKGRLSAAWRTISWDWQWSRWMEMGTVAALAAREAVWMSRPLEKVMAQGKNCRIRGERVVSAARTRARICSMLYLEISSVSE